LDGLHERIHFSIEGHKASNHVLQLLATVRESTMDAAALDGGSPKTPNDSAQDEDIEVAGRRI
jgi:hypothetical protein